MVQPPCCLASHRLARPTTRAASANIADMTCALPRLRARAGLMQFIAAGMAHKDDEELQARARSMRERFVPPEMLPMIQMMLQSMAPPPGAGGAAGRGGAGLPPW